MKNKSVPFFAFFTFSLFHCFFTFSFREDLSSDAIILHDFAHLLAIPLRDGCDLMDVIGRRLSSQIS